MEKNIILAGVGGQGILSIAYVIDNAALDAGYHFKQAEVHGMAQRGGAVQSNLRYSDREIHSDLIPTGKLDLVISVEPLEVLRYWHMLQPEGWVVASVTPYVNIPDYPEMEGLLDELCGFANLVLVDTAQLAKAAGNLRAQNMVTVGAASLQLDFEPEALKKHVAGLFAAKGDKIVAVNLQAFELGRAAGAFFRGLVDHGLGAHRALDLVRAIDPVTLDPELAGAWAGVAVDEPARLTELLSGGTPASCDRVTALA
jgi:indolepyruvate ferredoxin oxidoreductase beta subunit